MLLLAALLLRLALAADLGTFAHSVLSDRHNHSQANQVQINAEFSWRVARMSVAMAGELEEIRGAQPPAQPFSGDPVVESLRRIKHSTAVEPFCDGSMLGHVLLLRPCVTHPPPPHKLQSY